jgi:putative LysE/RhtB family amino acid efflux pump
MSYTFLMSGLAIGFAVAMPIGPMGLLCIQRSLISGMWLGLSTGLGAATVNVLYGALILFAQSTVAPLMASGGRVLSFAGGLFLLWSAARTFAPRRALAEVSGTSMLSPIAAYGSAVALNASNPMSPVRVAGLLAPVVGLSLPSTNEAILLLVGMFIAAAIWWVCLSGSVVLLRSRLTPGVLVRVNQAAGAMMTVYGALALARSAGL